MLLCHILECNFLHRCKRKQEIYLEFFYIMQKNQFIYDYEVLSKIIKNIQTCIKEQFFFIAQYYVTQQWFSLDLILFFNSISDLLHPHMWSSQQQSVSPKAQNVNPFDSIETVQLSMRSKSIKLTLTHAFYVLAVLFYTVIVVAYLTQLLVAYLISPLLVRHDDEDGYPKNTPPNIYFNWVFIPHKMFLLYVHRYVHRNVKKFSNKGLITPKNQLSMYLKRVFTIPSIPQTN